MERVNALTFVFFEVILFLGISIAIQILDSVTYKEDTHETYSSTLIDVKYFKNKSMYDRLTIIGSISIDIYNPQSVQTNCYL